MDHFKKRLENLFNICNDRPRQWLLAERFETPGGRPAMVLVSRFLRNLFSKINLSDLSLKT